MSTIPDRTDGEAEHHFDPLRCAMPTRTAIASLYALEPGWYRADQLAEALTAELPITENWVLEIFRWAARSGPLRRRRRGKSTFVYVDPGRMRRAWPGFDPTPYLVVPLTLEPLDLERGAA